MHRAECWAATQRRLYKVDCRAPLLLLIAIQYPLRATVCARQEPNSEPPKVGQIDRAASLDLLCNQMRCHEITHSSRYFIDHLLRVSFLLEDWGCSQEAVLCGLFHSVYAHRLSYNSYSRRLPLFWPRQIWDSEIYTCDAGLG